MGSEMCIRDRFIVTRTTIKDIVSGITQNNIIVRTANEYIVSRTSGNLGRKVRLGSIGARIGILAHEQAIIVYYLNRITVTVPNGISVIIQFR